MDNKIIRNHKSKHDQKPCNTQKTSKRKNEEKQPASHSYRVYKEVNYKTANTKNLWNCKSEIDHTPSTTQALKRKRGETTRNTVHIENIKRGEL